MVRAGIAVALAVVIAPGVRDAAEPQEIGFVVGLVTEFLLGSAIGMAAALLYDGAYAGGRMLDDYVGVKAIAPNLDLVAPSGFGRLWSLAFTGGYFLLGTYRTTIFAFAKSFDSIAPGVMPNAHEWSGFALSVASTIVLVACSVAGPAIALAFVVQVALGALSRTVPRFATFTLSFPLVFGAVLVATAISLPFAVHR